MEARLVWDTWRRLLTSDELVEWALRSDGVQTAPPGEFGSAESAILIDYASSREATDTNVGMYRRGLVRNARAGLGLTPVSRRIVQGSDLDFEKVASEFARSTGYRDHGPNQWRLAGELLSYLAGLPEFADPARQDAFALDGVIVALAQKLGSEEVEYWPEALARRFSTLRSSRAIEACRLRAHPATALVSLQHDLTPWLVQPDDFDANQSLEPLPTHWLIYFPAAEADVEYVELSERGARIFRALDTPKTVAEVSERLEDVSATDVIGTLELLLELGVVIGEGERSSRLRGAALDDAHPRGLFPGPTGGDLLLLDPAIELFPADAAGAHILCHTELEMGMSLPPGDGLVEFVTELMGRATTASALAARHEDAATADALITSLYDNGFLHVCAGPELGPEALEQYRASAIRRRSDASRPRIELDLDEGEPLAEFRELAVRTEKAPHVWLRCRNLSDHAETLAELAALRHDGLLRPHETVVVAQTLQCDAATCRALAHFGASILLEDVPWPTPPGDIPGLNQLIRNHVPVLARMRPGASLLDELARERATQWARSVSLSGLRLLLDPEEIWPDLQAKDSDFACVFVATEALGQALGDVRLAGLPSDQVLLGTAPPRARGPQSDLGERYRKAYLRWRLDYLRNFEGDNHWSQTPEAEEKLVPFAADLLPNRPDLLLIGPGSVVADVCGGIGRVARRLAPAVAPGGMIVSVEMLPCLVDRARGFAGDRGITNVQFRVGLAQRLPLADGSVDAAVNEWTGAIWELGLGPAMVAEMARVVRSGGRIAVTHRLVQLPLNRLHDPWVQYPDIYNWVRAAFDLPGVDILVEHVWGQAVPSREGERAASWRKQYIPPVVDPFDFTYDGDNNAGPQIDIFLTVIAERGR